MNYTQEKTADLLGVATITYSRYEGGKVYITEEMSFKIVKALKLDKNKIKDYFHIKKTTVYKTKID